MVKSCKIHLSTLWSLDNFEDIWILDHLEDVWDFRLLYPKCAKHPKHSQKTNIGTLACYTWRHLLWDDLVHHRWFERPWAMMPLGPGFFELEPTAAPKHLLFDECRACHCTYHIILIGYNYNKSYGHWSLYSIQRSLFLPLWRQRIGYMIYIYVFPLSRETNSPEFVRQLNHPML